MQKMDWLQTVSKLRKKQNNILKSTNLFPTKKTKDLNGKYLKQK